jgi:hypothetical protein
MRSLTIWAAHSADVPSHMLQSTLARALVTASCLVQDPPKVQPFAATLVSLAALGADNTRFVIQLPEDGSHTLGDHHMDSLQSASRLHPDGDGGNRVLQVDALKALTDAKVQCTIDPGAMAKCLTLNAHHPHHHHSLSKASLAVGLPLRCG